MKNQIDQTLVKVVLSPETSHDLRRIAEKLGVSAEKVLQCSLGIMLLYAQRKAAGENPSLILEAKGRKEVIVMPEN